jgi:hypothetical protein
VLWRVRERGKEGERVDERIGEREGVEERGKHYDLQRER